jgi:hypothetical protein
MTADAAMIDQRKGMGFGLVGIAVTEDSASQSPGYHSMSAM